MTRLGQWIHQRQSYSNPLFGTMVVLAGMLFPVFHASAAIEEPVQPMAQTAEQVIDAFDAVEHGATVEQAFFEQPLPYREFLRFQNDLYFDLFAQDRPLSGDAFLLDTEIEIDTDTFVYQCETQSGLAFELELAQLYLPDSDYSDYSPADIAVYQSVSDNSLGVVGSIRTTEGEFIFAGIILQLDHMGTRVNELLVTNEFSAEEYADLVEVRDLYGVDYYSYLASLPLPPDDVGGPVTDYDSCVNRARIIFNGRINGNRIWFGIEMAAWVLGTVVAAALCASTITVPIIGWLFSGSCAIKVAAAAALALAGIVSELAARNAFALNDFNTNRELCCFDFPETCPDEPV